MALPLRALRPRLDLAGAEATKALRAVQGGRLGAAGEVEAGAAEEMSACGSNGERPTAALGLPAGAKRPARSGERCAEDIGIIAHAQWRLREAAREAQSALRDAREALDRLERLERKMGMGKP